MLLCSEVYYALLEAKEQILTIDFVRTGYARALLTLSPVFDELIDELGKTRNVRHILTSLAKGLRIYSRHDSNPNEIKRAVDTLMAKAVIEKSSRGSYYFVEPMLKSYLINKIDIY
jgi:hypothetical protein